MEKELELTSQAEETHFWFRGFRAFVTPALADIAGQRRDLRLIDCGCGTGHNLALLAAHGRAWGFDLSRGGVERARHRGRQVVRASVVHIPFASSTFDVATAFDVLQCVANDDQAVQEMARILKPGGALLLTVAAFEALRGDHSIAWQEVRRYTPASARRLVEQAGLRADRLSFLFASVLPLVVLARTTQRILRPFRGVRADSDIRVPTAPINDLLTRIVTTEATVARRWSMPIGSSILVVARKP
jgi:ubiquinone/menaquinone biosynthesis C-methylase UbiE